ncbi:alpha/beta fold hydrolase [Streptomyces sp. NPDC051173]|uniref:thioesterase II family protein n=1 Tax=Streptomyces sp. NPDC051173 TaxID=3155164 RepID=UPI003450DCD2
MEDRPPHMKATTTGTSSGTGIGTGGGSGSGVWLRRYQIAPSPRARLVCFPHAGGSASYYVPVSRRLSPELDVLAVQYPSRQDRRHEPCVEDIGALADRIIPELLPLADRPLALFGHSMGAAVAFETVRRLEERGVAPAVLFESSRPSPSSVRDEFLHRSGDRALITEMQRLDATDAGILEDPELLEMILPILRGDYKAVETYRCRPPDAAVDCPVVVLFGDEDPQATHEECLRWKNHTRGRFDMHVFEGGHFYLNSHAEAVMRIVAERIRQ